MKKVTIIALVSILMLQCSIKAGIVAYFHLNQDYIASTLCENKSNATMNCKGKCYLNKKIKEQEKQETKLASILKELKDGSGFLPSGTLFSLEPAAFIVRASGAVYLTKSYSSPLAEILQPPC